MKTLLGLTIVLVAGTAVADGGRFQNPVTPGADPWMEYFEGNYYLTTTQG